MTTLTELTTILGDVDTQLGKATAEILGAIQTLRDELANVALSQAAEEALADLKVKAQALDDIVPDITPDVTPDVPPYVPPDVPVTRRK